MTSPTEQPVRAFLDANVLLSAAIDGAGSSKLWALPGVCLVTSEYALREAHINLGNRPDATQRIEKLNRLMQTVELVPHLDQGGLTASLFSAWSLPDPDDIPILLGAIESHCDYLITLDSACFGHMYGTVVDGVEILKPGKFLQKRGV